MSNNLYWDELDEDQICIEILKRFPLREYESTGSMYYFFGKEWGFLDPSERKKAEQRFLKIIQNGKVKGIQYILTKKKGNSYREKETDEHGDYLYTRIYNDRYRK